MDSILKRIAQADGAEIDMILDVVIRRKRVLYPDWDMLYISLPKKDKEERRRTIEYILEYMKKEQDAL